MKNVLCKRNMQKNMYKSLHRVRFMHKFNDFQDIAGGICFNNMTFYD